MPYLNATPRAAATRPSLWLAAAIAVVLAAPANAQGQPALGDLLRRLELLEQRQANRSHQIEEVGAQLRNLMPFITPKHAP